MLAAAFRLNRAAFDGKRGIMAQRGSENQEFVFRWIKASRKSKSKVEFWKEIIAVIIVPFGRLAVACVDVAACPAAGGMPVSFWRQRWIQVSCHQHNATSDAASLP